MADVWATDEPTGEKMGDEVISILVDLMRRVAISEEWPTACFEWHGALARKPGKPALDYLSYRELWVQEHLWTAFLSMFRIEWAEAVGETRAWAQAGWEPGRAHTEPLLGAKAGWEDALARGLEQGDLFLDYKRFHPMIPHNKRTFCDAWVGVRRVASKMVAEIQWASRLRT